MQESIEVRALRWALGDDTGASSKAIAAVMTGNMPDKRHVSYPHDGGDLGRCLRLLKAVPEWRARLPEMGERNGQWKALVEAWDELDALYAREEASGRSSDVVYKRMKQILEKPEAADRNLIRLGPNVSMRFGA